MTQEQRATKLLLATFWLPNTLSVFATSAAVIFVHQTARPIKALVRGAAPAPVVTDASLHIFVGLNKT